MGLGRNIKFHRTRLQMTLDQLAEESGVELGTISALENRDSKRSQFAPALARALGLTLEELLDDSGGAATNLPPLARARAAQRSERLGTLPHAGYDRLTASQKRALHDIIKSYIAGCLGSAPERDAEAETEAEGRPLMTKQEIHELLGGASPATETIITKGSARTKGEQQPAATRKARRNLG